MNLHREITSCKLQIVAIAITEETFPKPTFQEVSQVEIQTMKTIQLGITASAVQHITKLAQERRFANLTNPWNGEPEDTCTF